MITPERIRKYLERRQEDLHILDAAIPAGDFSAIQAVAHKIKGNAALFGFVDLGEIAKNLEAEAENRAETQVIVLRDQFSAWLIAKQKEL